jgi:hypothetical protein
MNKKYLTEEERKEAKRLYNKNTEKKIEKIKNYNQIGLRTTQIILKDLAKSEKEIIRKRVKK